MRKTKTKTIDVSRLSACYCPARSLGETCERIQFEGHEIVFVDRVNSVVSVVYYKPLPLPPSCAELIKDCPFLSRLFDYD